jgi:hypothetical protein
MKLTLDAKAGVMAESCLDGIEMIFYADRYVADFGFGSCPAVALLSCLQESFVRFVLEVKLTTQQAVSPFELGNFSDYDHVQQ